MSTGIVLGFLPSPDSQVEKQAVRPDVSLLPGSGGASTGEIRKTQTVADAIASPQDEVKVQLEQPGEIPVYQFVNQQGSLILQVPSEQILSLARQIAQELAQEAAPKAPIPSQGGKNNVD